jgi:hypothetical protein
MDGWMCLCKQKDNVDGLTLALGFELRKVRAHAERITHPYRKTKMRQVSPFCAGRSEGGSCNQPKLEEKGGVLYGTHHNTTKQLYEVPYTSLIISSKKRIMPSKKEWRERKKNQSINQSITQKKEYTIHLPTETNKSTKIDHSLLGYSLT